MIQTINNLITTIFDVILYPFTFIHEFWGILFLSIIVSFVVLVVFKYVSSPKKIKDTKNRIKSNILAIRLYKDFWIVIVSSFFKSLVHVLKYFTLNLGPILVVIVILFPMFVQMDVRYGMRSFMVGENVIIKAKFSKDPNKLKIKLLENNSVKLVMNPVFINSFRDKERTIPIREVNWKLESINNGISKVKIKINDKIFEKNLIIGVYKGALSNKKLVKSSLQHFLYPAEGLFEKTEELKSVYIKYPGKNVNFLGIKIHWIILNIIIVVIVVLGFRKKFGIEF